jgi:hypothetical protein
MMRDDFAVFILTHGRPEKVVTYKTLQECGYTGRTFIVIDDEDKKADRYKSKFGDKVLQFCKSEVAKTFDEGDNFNDRRAIIYARNACFDLARQVGVRYFLQLDDDYTGFHFKLDCEGAYTNVKIKDLDFVFECYLEYLKSTPFKTICMAQNGDFIGGSESQIGKKKHKRKAMNTFFCDVENRFHFVGRINEDVNTYSATQRAGVPFLTVGLTSVSQKTTQANAGGMTELYLDQGTYVKSFYSVMYCPSAVIVKDMGDNHRRLHHSVSYDACAPKIIEERHRRRSNATR